jgi:hypothetical protein
MERDELMFYIVIFCPFLGAVVLGLLGICILMGSRGGSGRIKAYEIILPILAVTTQAVFLSSSM